MHWAAIHHQTPDDKCDGCCIADRRAVQALRLIYELRLRPTRLHRMLSRNIISNCLNLLAAKLQLCARFEKEGDEW